MATNDFDSQVSEYQEANPRASIEDAVSAVHALRRVHEHVPGAVRAVAHANQDERAAPDLQTLCAADFDDHVTHHLAAHKGMSIEDATSEVLALRRVHR